MAKKRAAGTRAKTGRKPAVLDPTEVAALAESGCTNEEIAAFLGVCADTLAARFSEAIKKGKLRGDVSLRRKQQAVALSGSVPMLIWLGKQRLGQSEKNGHDLSKLTNDQLFALFERTGGRGDPTSGAVAAAPP